MSTADSTDVRLAMAPQSISTNPTTTKSAVRIKIVLLVLALLGHVAVTLFVTQPGRLNGDEGVYHMMIYNLVEHGRLDFWNGLDELPSKELKPFATQVIGDRLVPQYPHLFIFLAAPFYLLAGFKGLFFLNALAFVGTVGLTIALAKRAFQDTNLALNAALLLVFATFSWEYSQAAWPHSIAVFLALGGFTLGYLALLEPRAGRAAALAFGAGLAFGLGAGTRLDSILVMPGIVAAFLLLPRVRLLPPLAMLAGLLPALGVLAWTNFVKFGSLSPFSYGATSSNSLVSPERYLPLFVLGACGLLALYVVTRPRAATWFQRRWLLAAAAVAVIAVLAVAILPPLQQTLSRLILGLHALVFDMRAFPIEEGWIRRAIQRTESGGMSTPFHGWKKALLQSSPFLVLWILPVVALIRRPQDRFVLFLLFLAAAGPILIFSYAVWHGGSPINMRYFLGALPFAVILAAYGWRDLAVGLSARWCFWLFALGVATLIGASLLTTDPRFAERTEDIVYLIPLVLAAVLALSVVAWLLLPKGLARVAGGLAIVGAVLAFVWSGVIAYIYDYPRTYVIRLHSAQLAALAEQQVAPDSLVFLPSYFPFSAFFEKDRVRLAAPFIDDYQDFEALMTVNFEAGRKVYIWIDKSVANTLEERGLLQGIEKTSLGKVHNTELFRLEAPKGRL